MEAALDVVCPEGVAPGDLISVEAHGQAYEVIVPDGVEPGSTFQVRLEGDELTAHADVDLESLAADLAKIAAAGTTDAPAAPASSQRRLTSADAATIRSLMEALFDADELDEWIDDNAPAFASYSRDGEQQLGWTSLHLRFQQLVEATIHDQLHDLGANVEQLYSMLAAATGGDPRADAFLSRLLALEDYHKFCDGMCQDTSRLKFSFLDLANLYAHELPEASDSWLQRAGLTWQERAQVPDSSPVLEENPLEG